MWFSEGWVELAKLIRSHYPSSTILINWGSPDEKILGERIVREVGKRIELLPWFSIKELIPVIKKMNLVIGGDTGPVYIAAAVGVPTVSFFRATDADRYAPRGEKHRALQAQMSCTPCLQTSCDKDRECSRSINVENVFEAVTQLIG
jgi:heptosyltransferase-1